MYSRQFTYNWTAFNIFEIQLKRKQLLSKLHDIFILFYEQLVCIVILQTQVSTQNNIQIKNFQEIGKTGNNIIPSFARLCR